MGANAVILSRSAALSLALAVMSACSTSAFKLPGNGSAAPSTTLSGSQFTQAELSKSCATIGKEQETIAARTVALTGQVNVAQEKDQDISYASAFVAPLSALAMETNSEEKAELKQLEQRWDRLVGLRRFKNCS